MAKTIIDELVVTLGLDPKNFKKGEKESVQALRELEKNAKRTGEEVAKAGKESGESWMAAGKRFLAVAAIWKILSYTTRNILAMSDATFDLANASMHLGQNAKYLRNFQNVAEMMGGTAEGALNTIGNLHKAISDAKFTGVVSNQMIGLARLGVQFTDSAGRMKDFKDIYLDTATAIQQQQQMGNMSQSEALDYLTNQAGFDPGLARAAVGGRDSAAAALARQEARRQISDEDVSAATANQQAIISANQAKDSAFVHAATAASGTIVRVATAKEGLYNAGNTGEISEAWESLKAAVEPLSTGLVDLTFSAEHASKSLLGWARSLAGKGREHYESQIQASAKKYGLDPEILAGVLHTESRFDPDAISPAGARGIAQLMPQYFPDAGVDPLNDIDTAASYLSQLKRSFLKTNGGNEADALDKALMAYNGGERRVRTSEFGDGTGKPLTGETVAYPGQVYEYAAAHAQGGAGSSTTNVDIGELNVHTQATDADGMARAADGALKRKLGAAHAEQGMQ